MKYFPSIVLIIFFLIIKISLTAQIRYLDSLFEAEKSQKAVVYGEAEAINFPYLSEKFTRNKELKADVFEPKADSLKSRACVIVAHGGAFMTGNRKYKNIRKACEYFAQKGYVVLTIDYRKGYNGWSSKAAERAVYRGIQDMKTAIRYVKENANSLRIDTNLVFAFGTSAGSIMSLHAAYLEESERKYIPATYEKIDLACLSCSGNNFEHNDKPIAVANLWGAFIDTNLINNRKIPVISFHGTKDKIVSPDKKSPLRTPFYKPISGSNLITPRLENLEIKTHYHSFKNKRHEPWGILITKPEFDTIMNKTTVFFFDVLVNQQRQVDVMNSYVEVKMNTKMNTKNAGILLNNNSLLTYKVLIINNLGEVIYSDYLNDGRMDSSLKIPTQDFSRGDYYLIFYHKTQITTRYFTL